MIISHKHKYVFVQLPHTGCSAVARELCEFYAGEPILRKHSYYHQFLRGAAKEEKEYFTFSTIRNPLDEYISVFHKLKSNHEKYDDLRNSTKNGGFVTARMRRRFYHVQRTGDIVSDFLRYSRLPHDNWSRLDHRKFDYVMRFERLQQDFEEVLRKLGVEQVRPLPHVNPTRQPEEADRYGIFPEEVRKRVHWVFSPFMEDWGYDFPSNWEMSGCPASSRIVYEVCGFLKSAYWRRQ
jgi:hypothetical protein